LIFLCIFDQLNAALVSIRDLKKTLTKLFANLKDLIGRVRDFFNT